LNLCALCLPPPARVPACFRQGSSYLCAYKARKNQSNLRVVVDKNRKIEKIFTPFLTSIYENQESRIEHYFRLKRACSPNYRGTSFFAPGQQAQISELPITNNLGAKRKTLMGTTNNHLSIINNHLALGTSTTVKSSLQISPFYAKQSQFPKKSNERK